MAIQTETNDQVTDATTQSNVEIVGEATAVATGDMYQLTGHSLGILFQNAVNQQQHQNTIAQAVSAKATEQIYSVDIASSRKNTRVDKVLRKLHKGTKKNKK